VDDLINSAYQEIVIFAIIAIIAGLIGFFRNIRKCLDKQSDRILGLMKAMQLLAREIDKQENRHHQNADSTLKYNIDTILKDDKGNL